MLLFAEREVSVEKKNKFHHNQAVLENPLQKMVLGWRRVFCSSTNRDRDEEESNSTNFSPRICSKFGFFSNPSTPRLQSLPVSSPGLRCRTRFDEESVGPVSSVVESPRNRGFSLLKSSLRLSKSRCGICLQTVRAGQGMAIFTAECSHSFHFPCIVTQMRKQSKLLCPVCNFHWTEMPLLSENQSKLKTKTESNTHCLKVYNDDEPLMSPNRGAIRFNPIPESDEENEDGVEFQGFFVNNSPTIAKSRNIELSVMAEAVVVAVRRSFQAQAIVLKVKAPPAETKSTQRASIDVVTVVDVSGKMTSEKLQFMKRTMKLIISQMTSADRLSIVAFSSSSKRLSPLKSMTPNGKRSVRRIVEAMVALDGVSRATDAVKKAAKVLEDRRDRNSVATIILLSDESPTTFPDVNVPVHCIQFRDAQNGDVFGNIRSLLSVVVQDLTVELSFQSGSAEIAAVYSHNGSPQALGSGLINLGELYGGEERELLVELKMKIPSSSARAHHILSARCSFTDPSTQQTVAVTSALSVPHAVRSSAPEIQRLRSFFISTRAVAESRKLADLNDLTGAHHMLSSARALLLQSNQTDVSVRSLEAELAEIQRRRKGQLADRFAFLDEKGEPLTPTSAWRAAECLAKVAMMKKSLNRVSDLHGFEDARF